MRNNAQANTMSFFEPNSIVSSSHQRKGSALNNSSLMLSHPQKIYSNDSPVVQRKSHSRHDMGVPSITDDRTENLTFDFSKKSPFVNHSK